MILDAAQDADRRPQYIWPTGREKRLEKLVAYAIPDGDGKGNKNENSKLACGSKQPEARQLIHSEGRGDHRCDPANHAQKKRTAPRCVTAGKSGLQYSGTKCAKMRFTLSNGVTERKKKMSKFKDNVKLLYDLQSLIDEAQKTANPPEYAKDVFGAISPVLNKVLPAARMRAVRQIDILSRAKGRLEELMEAEHETD